MEASKYQLPETLFTEAIASECITRCEAYGVCGGSRATAPCGCSWPLESGKRYQCGECYQVCREIRQVDPLTGELGAYSFARHIAAGYSLEQTTIIQQNQPQFPLFIPLHTQDYTGGTLPLRWVGADVRWLFNLRGRGTATLKAAFATEATTRQYLKVGPACQLLTVLNGEDWMLEKLWQMPRQTAFEQLAAVGFEASTGATFSVTPLTTLGNPVSFAHHSAMLMRHHRVLAETQAAGLHSAPNLYWLDGDLREVQRWAQWLRANPTLGTVSRDFTSTTRGEVMARKVQELLYLLQLAGRSFHVLVVGTGPVNAPLVLSALTRAGHTATIVTSAPIMKAQSGEKYELDSRGEIVSFPCDADLFPFPRLFEHNLSVFEQRLFLAIADTPAAHVALPNVQTRVAFSS